jgi:uncharacterized membrane protein
MERLVFFSDAVFAIVITLLVLPLAAEVDLPEDGEDLATSVWHLWPEALSFVISFMVIGQFWLAHHRMFTHVDRYDHGLLWANLVCLLTVSFLPFPTAVLGSAGSDDETVAVVFYASSMTVTSICFTLMWIYAQRRGLLAPEGTDQEHRNFTARSIVTSAVFLCSVAAAFAGLAAAVLFWLVLLPAVRIGLAVVHARRAQVRV